MNTHTFKLWEHIGHTDPRETKLVSWLMTLEHNSYTMQGNWINFKREEDAIVFKLKFQLPA